MKKLIFLLTLVLTCALPAQAVLKEKDLAQTLSVLRSELEQFKAQQVTNTANFDERFKSMGDQMRKVMQQADQTTLMLYSQQSDYIFDLTYACHEATEEYHRFHTNVMPYSNWVDRMKTEIERYESLIASLQKIPDFLLSDKAKEDRETCLELATVIRDKMKDNREKITELQERHDRVEKRLKELNDYAKDRYTQIQANIFVNGGDNYITILSNFQRRLKIAVSSIESKYKPTRGSRSDWRGPIVMFLFLFVFLWMAVSSGFSVVFINWLVPKKLRDEKFQERKPCMIWTMAITTFAIVVMILRNVMSTHGFFAMASKLLIEYAWLLAVILISLLIRLWQHPERLKRGMLIYLPIFFLGFVVIAFRIVFIPNETVNLVFPPILIACLIWQFVAIYRHNNGESG